MMSTALEVIDRELRRSELYLEQALVELKRTRKVYFATAKRVEALSARTADLKTYLAEQGYTRQCEVEAFLEDNADGAGG